MNLSRFSFALSALMLGSFGLFAQPGGATTGVAPFGKVSGKLIDAQNKPVSYATVTLLRPDSTVVNGDLTKDDGSFSIGPTGAGNFILSISAIGLKPKYIPDIKVTQDAPESKLGAIKAASATNTLKEVEITSEKRVMEMSVDKKVFNVEKNTTSAGGSATDVLQNVPSVTVDADGNVSLRGKSGVTILIDGKPSTLLGADAASALQSLPAASIESVEVITNPSAKYDAQGLSGIINIVTKKDGRLGMNGNITLGAGTGDKYNGNLGLNMRKGKWNVFLNSSFRFNSNYNKTTIDVYKKSDTSTHSYENSHRHFDGSFNTIGATYDFNKNNSLTLTENINIMQFKFFDTGFYNTYRSLNETGDNLVSTLGKTSNGLGGPVSTSTSLDYRKKFKKPNEELSVDATLSLTHINREQNYTSYNYDNAYTLLPYNPIRQSAPGSGYNNSLNIWADYTDPLFTKNGKLGLGFKSQFFWFDSKNTPLVDTTGIGHTAVKDYSLLNIYNYTQQIHAAYVNWNDQIGKFTYQAGLRYEDAFYNANNTSYNDTSYKRNFSDLFPSAFVSYQLKGQQSVYLNYSRRINRPTFWDLFPNKDLSNPGVISQGNPDLKPEYINSVEFSYSKQTTRGDNFILSAYYQYTTDLIARVTTVLPAGDRNAGELFTMPQNVASANTYGLEGTGRVQVLPIWEATVNLNFFQNEINDNNVASLKGLSGLGWFGKINTTIKLPANFSLQLNGNYESPKIVPQGKVREVYWVDAALRKNLWKNKATLIFNVSDIFDTHKYNTDFHTPGYDETYLRNRETRIGTFTFTYRFGKSDMGNKQGAANGGRRTKPAANTQNPNAPKEKDRGNNLKDGEDSGDQGGGGQGGGGTK